MDVLLVRHGESEGNARGEIQGHSDAPLTKLGRLQAEALGRWLSERGARWTAAYASPLARASETAKILSEKTGHPAPEVDADVREVGVGELEGMNRNQIASRYPTFLARAITELGDFQEFGGEAYDGVQERMERFKKKLLDRHGHTDDTVLVVAHGGFNFHFVKSSVCLPNPRVCILTWGNCTTTLLRYRERRGAMIGEVAWHLPIELIGGQPSSNATRLFR